MNPMQTRSLKGIRRHLERVSPGGKLEKFVEPTAVAEKLWSTLDTPLALGLSLLVKNGQLQDALAVRFQPGRYLECDVEAARDDYQAIAFLQKAPLTLEGVDREKAAWESFLQAEEQCRMTNARFRHHQSNPALIPPGVRAVISAAGHKILEILGGGPSAKSWMLRCRFGPGADSLNKGSHAQAYHKLSERSVTHDFYDGAQALLLSQPGWYRNVPLQVCPQGQVSGGMFTVPGNSVTFVPKTALIDRSIAVEPGMNIYAQLGLGAIIRARLKRAGLDLDNADPNRGLAKEGSINGTVATIDLSSASDTLAREVVRELLPASWYAALDWVRSKSGSYTPKGAKEPHILRYEKFSSMGNGFTFELESMIFYALALECTRYCRDDTRLVRCFGDDITVPTGVVSLLEEVLSYCGFRFNTAKSYTSGVFRESCGMDFFNGVNIRPFYFKEESLETIPSLFRLANGIRRAAYRRNLGFGCDRKLRPLWVYVVQRIPSAFRDVVVPPTPVVFLDERLAAEREVAEVDGGLMSNWHEASISPLVSFNRDYQHGWNFCVYKGSSKYFSATDESQLKCFALYRARDGMQPPENFTADKITYRGEGLPRLKPGLHVPVWPDIGLWC